MLNHGSKQFPSGTQQRQTPVANRTGQIPDGTHRFIIIIYNLMKAIQAFSFIYQKQSVYVEMTQVFCPTLGSFTPL